MCRGSLQGVRKRESKRTLELRRVVSFSLSNIFPFFFGCGWGKDRDVSFLRSLLRLESLSTGEISGRFFGVFANKNRPLISPVESRNPKPRVFRLPSQNALINRYGLNSLGAEDMARRLRERVRLFAYNKGYGFGEEAGRSLYSMEVQVCRREAWSMAN
jgi:hypothetical protein